MILDWTRMLAIACGIALLMAGAGCGGKATPAGLNSGAPVPTRIDQDKGFSVMAVEPASDARLELSTIQEHSQLVVRVESAKAQQLDALLFELSYDAARYTPLAAQATDALGPLADSLCLKVLDTPGTMSFGQVPLTVTAQQVDAGEVLAEVLFRAEPFTVATMRAASQVPAHAQALSPLTWDAEEGVLHWYYVNPGDFDQNGEVGISDLVPLGQHYRESGPFAFTSALSIIDADGNGEINVADLSVIGQYWGNAVEQYNVYASAEINDVPLSYSAPSAIASLVGIELRYALGDPAVDRLWFTYTLAAAQEELYFWVRPEAQGAEGTRSNLSGPLLGAPPVWGPSFNLAPTACLSLRYTGSHAPLRVDLDATESTDPDGVIVFFEWDFEGDGLYDALSDYGLCEHTYVQPGSYAPLVRVTDDGGAWDVFQSAPLTVTTTGVANVDPQADITATVLVGREPLTVGFIATGSRDVDGYIAKYEWDFEGDGAFDLDSGTDPTVLYTYTAAGTFNATVRVTDDEGAVDLDSIQVEVTGELPNEPPIAKLSATPTSGYVPLTVEFDALDSIDPDGWIHCCEWDFNGDDVYESYGVLSVMHTYTDAGTYSATVRITDNLGWKNTASVTIAAREPTRISPIAELYIFNDQVESGDTVIVSALKSRDLDGNIVNYSWDLNGNGLFSEEGNGELATEGQPITTLVPELPGQHLVSVRVTDNDGRSDTASTWFTISGWTIVTIDSDALDSDTSLVVVDGCPAICYRKLSSGVLNYARATTSTGADPSDWQRITLQSTKYAYDYSSMAVVDGCPAISYYRIDHSTNPPDRFLEYTRATTSTGADPVDWQTVAVDSNGSVRSISLAVVNGCPAISYQDLTNYDLKYARATTSTGGDPADWQAITIDSAGYMGAHTSLAVVAGCPAISYCDYSNDDLKYARATTSTGEDSADWQIITIDSAGYVDSYTSLAVVDSCPAISYCVHYSGLKYVRAITSTGTDPLDWQTICIDTAGRASTCNSLAVVNGCPAISYASSFPNKLKYAQSSTSTGASVSDWQEIVAVDGMDVHYSPGESTSLATVDGYPAISFTSYEAGNHNLMYAILLWDEP